ncbi:uncharacterized protein LOC131681342 [Topomyia yanbarensis]|uniref:uncharacterized protein LOC131681342 n=1 Tax=Topomyia yanbarensis TaxID=2498891 RepID=UPI00273C440A|nr:uncharacterized protein LOC131681342 [Topomyia yanbarensis]
MGKAKRQETPPPEDEPEEVEEEVKEEEEPDIEEEQEEPLSEDEEGAEKTVFELLHEFIRKTNEFLNQYNDMVENRMQHRTLWLKRLSPLREALVTFLIRYMQNQLPRDDYLYVHIKCCGDERINKEDFAKHYTVTHKKADADVTVPEMQPLIAYYKSLRKYQINGRVVNEDLLFAMRRLLRKTNMILGGY